MDLLGVPTVAALAAGLGAAAVVLAVLTAVTARRPTSVPDRDGYLDRWSTLHGGYDPRGNVWVRGWLSLGYAVARPLAVRGVAPDVMTAWGVWLSALVLVPAAAGGRWALAGALLVVASGLGDTLDGAVAVLTGRTTRWGYVLDSVADRLSDLLLLSALVVLGGSVVAAVAAGVALYTLEYLRARAGNAGIGEVGVVTVGERATRIVVITATLVSAGVLPGLAGIVAEVGLWAVAGLGTVGVVQLAVVVRRLLGDAGSGGPGRGSGGADEPGDDVGRQGDERQPAAGVRGPADEEQPRHG